MRTRGPRPAPLPAHTPVASKGQTPGSITAERRLEGKAKPEAAVKRTRKPQTSLVLETGPHTGRRAPTPAPVLSLLLGPHTTQSRPRMKFRNPGVFAGPSHLALAASRRPLGNAVGLGQDLGPHPFWGPWLPSSPRKTAWGRFTCHAASHLEQLPTARHLGTSI